MILSAFYSELPTWAVVQRTGGGGEACGARRKRGLTGGHGSNEGERQ